jgi:hypothetical protein
LSNFTKLDFLEIQALFIKMEQVLQTTYAQLAFLKMGVCYLISLSTCMPKGEATQLLLDGSMHAYACNFSLNLYIFLYMKVEC